MEPFDPAELPELLKLYYRRLFPYAQYYRWLNYGGGEGGGERDGRRGRERRGGYSCPIPIPIPPHHRKDTERQVDLTVLPADDVSMGV